MQSTYIENIWIYLDFIMMVDVIGDMLTNFICEITKSKQTFKRDNSFSKFNIFKLM